jgi:predicted lipoprotein with Yx(FWY)xxD motif
MSYDALLRRAGLLAVSSVALVIAACSNPAPTSVATPVPVVTQTPAPVATGTAVAATPAVTTAATQTATQAPSPSSAFTVSTAPIICCDQSLALVGPDDMTLYTFDNDTTPDKSACESTGCASTWPALIVTGTPTAGPGINGTLATFTRADGTTQVSYNGKPLYYFAADTKPGDTSGDGLNDVWHIAKP